MHVQKVKVGGDVTTGRQTENDNTIVYDLKKEWEKHQLKKQERDTVIVEQEPNVVENQNKTDEDERLGDTLATIVEGED